MDVETRNLEIECRGRSEFGGQSSQFEGRRRRFANQPQINSGAEGEQLAGSPFAHNRNSNTLQFVKCSRSEPAEFIAAQLWIRAFLGTVSRIVAGVRDQGSLFVVCERIGYCRAR